MNRKTNSVFVMLLSNRGRGKYSNSQNIRFSSGGRNEPVFAIIHLCAPCSPEEYPASSSSERTAGCGGPFNQTTQISSKDYLKESSTMQLLHKLLAVVLNMLRENNRTPK